MILSVNTSLAEGNKAALLDTENGSSFSWELMEVCEARKKHLNCIQFREQLKPKTTIAAVLAMHISIQAK